MSTTKVIDLKYPITVDDGETISQVKLRRPTVGDMRAIAKISTEVEQETVLFARLTGLNPEDLDKMDRAVDYMRVGEAYNDFFEDGPYTPVQ